MGGEREKEDAFKERTRISPEIQERTPKGKEIMHPELGCERIRKWSAQGLIALVKLVIQVIS